MSNFSSDNQGNFGVPGVSIEPTLSSTYDPYSGIDLTNINSCDYIEVMTLPSGVSSEEVFCDDPFAANGPAWFGGTGEPGSCKNFGRVNVRSLGVLPNGDHPTIDGGAYGYAHWFWGWVAGGTSDSGYSDWTSRNILKEEVDKFMAHDHWHYGPLGPAFWGYLNPDGTKIEGDPTRDDMINTYNQYISFNSFSTLQFLYSSSPEGFAQSDFDRNIMEMRLYWTPNENDFTTDYDDEADVGEIFRFSQTGDDWFGFYMDDGCGNDLELGNGGQHSNMTSPVETSPQPGSVAGHHNNYYYNDSTYNPGNGGLGDYGYSFFDKTIHKFCSDGNPTNYRILVRQVEETGGHSYNAGYQSPRGKQLNGGEWESYDKISGTRGSGLGGGQTSNAPGVHNINPTFKNPSSPIDENLQDDSNGDGQYYRTDAIGEDETPYYEGSDTVDGLDISLTQQGVREYVQSINCNTVINTKIADFNRMRAVCIDGSYVEMANNGDSINQILDPTPITEELSYLVPVSSVTGTYQIRSNNNSLLYRTATVEGVGTIIDLISHIKVTSIRISGDLNASDEYVNVQIGDKNFPGLSSGEQGSTIYEVGAPLVPRFIDKNYTGPIGESDGRPSGQVYIEGNDLKIPLSFNSTSDVDLNVSHTGHEYTIEIDFEVEIGSSTTLTYVSGYENYTFLSGDDACNSITYFNSDLYYLSDADDRPSLGLFSTIDNNVTSENFESNLMDEQFNQISKKQFIQNGDGRYVKKHNYYYPPEGQTFNDVGGYDASSFNDTILDTYQPQGGWDYINFDGAGVNVTKGNTPGDSPQDPENIDDSGNPTLNLPHSYPNGNYSKRFIQHPQHTPHSSGVDSYAGFYPYVGGYGDEFYPDRVYQESLDMPLQWARWVQSDECYSYQRCLKFQADNRWSDTANMSELAFEQIGTKQYQQEDGSHNITDILKLANNNEYRTINQFQQFYSENDTTINPYSSLEVSFWMKTLEDNLYQITNPPHVQVSVTRGGIPKTPPSLRYELKDEYGEFVNDEFPNRNYIDQSATHNSISSNSAHTFNSFGTANVFRNSKTMTWEKFTFTFNLYSAHNRDNIDIKNLYLLAQATSINPSEGFRGTVLLDNFEVKESYKFMPDVDVRKKKGPNVFGKADLTKYYDKTIHGPDGTDEYQDTVAPLEVQFYFYPRHNYENIFNESREIIYNDFRQGMFYLFDVDWGDDSPKEFVNEPQKIDENTAVYHTYETAGIYEITGTMLRMKPNKEYEPIGVIHNERFVLRIMINEGLDEDFTYFGSDGFSFIPYKNTLPIIGGYSEQSIYYKSIVRNLGILDENNLINTNFESVGDRLKTEISLDKMDSSFSDDFKLLNAFTQERTNEDGDTIYNGLNTNKDELGKSIGDTDITNIRYFNKPMQIWEMFGFEEVEEYSDFVTSDEYLSTLPFPQYFEEFDINSNGYINAADAVGWVNIGRPDIYSYLIEFVTTNTTNSIPSIYDESEPGGQGGSTPQPRPTEEFSNLIGPPNQNHYGLLSSPRYWKRIIPEENIFDRNNLYYEIGRTDLINENSNQDYNDVNYYYPILPKFSSNGGFQENNYPFRNGEQKIPFPLTGPITDEKYKTNSLKISIGTNSIERNVLNDESGNKNYGFVFNDYKPKFNNETLKPAKTKNVTLVKTTKKNGAF